ncbi:MAG: CHAP domain-containing protein [Ruminococcaceae bacterium]|nr:CHAP domain-containing protein [Oscillospiraceae bacterium]
MKKGIVRVFVCLLCAMMLLPCIYIPASAEKLTYATGAAGVSEAYKNSKYYKNLTSIELTGDGVTDTLAVALSQLEYVEGTNTSGFSGTQGGGGNYTEFCRNYGEGNSYAWCAAYVSFCLFQSRATTSATKNTIWRGIYCPTWYNRFKNEGRAHAASSNYTPQPGDLVFFKGSGHIGIVRYSKDGKVYTIEGNTSNSAGLNPEGGGVYCKSYDRNYSKFDGFGTPPYKKNDKAFKVDYTGEKPTTGLWISDTAKNFYSTTSLSGTFTEIPKGTIFEVTKLLSKTCYEVKYNGKTGYIKAQGGSPIYQVTSNAAYKAVPDKIETEKVTPNKYVITDTIKSVKEHVGSGITKYTLDGTKINEAQVYGLNAGQKIGVSGFAGFTTSIRDFGYYFDGNAESVVWNTVPMDAKDDVKKKAGDKAKMFDINADTSSLSNGAHTVTFVAKFINNNTCDLITLNLNVGGSTVVGDIAVGGDASESSTGGAESKEVGCRSAIGVGVALPIIVFAGAVIIKKKKED